MIRSVLLMALGLLLGWPGVARAQVLARAGSDGSELRVYLLTFGPGKVAWEKFGHNAIWVSDPGASSRGANVAYNYGLFEFVWPDFFVRFIQGRMRYWMEGWSADATLAAYVDDGRDVWVDELNLSPAQKLQIKTFLEWNALEPNKFYRYDYYIDNCSTRVRDALDLATGGQIRPQLEARSTDTTYRFHTRRLMQSDWVLYTGIDFILGQPTDLPINAWEESFLPVRLRQHLLNAEVLMGDRPEKLIGRSTQLGVSTRFVEHGAPPGRVGVFLVVGLTYGLLQIALGWFSTRRRSRVWKVLLGALVLPWLMVLSLGGTLGVWTWGFSNHRATVWNENLMQAHPLVWPMILLLPLALCGRVTRLGRNWAWGIWFVSMAGLVLQVLPGWDQVNGESLALIVPTHVALAWVMWQIDRTRRKPAQAAPSGLVPLSPVRGAPV